ncbi:beta-glucosidase [Agarivorans sp. B2Z047]|uniref:GH1 family beta-glucosidase n=1 Tax=unclassified Agarivorans TaxID=2636026 RepID=UPI00128D4740|nr:GH1 family beta-glucosidase [Agarivorans sp. B2Z047]MPW30271.1 beta-glucosidase [Agarivorans sp. B2Z047]UQN43098.1 beta-glucosidase [Agarivorans sp. B2Z047]
MSFDFPKSSPFRRSDFIFGVATAAFQIEGANQEDERCESIWDRFCATPGKVANGDDGTIACDHYHRWEEDLEMIAELGVDAYRLSIAWPRIMPVEGQINDKGIAFYQQLIAKLKQLGIKPFVTLYHWDLPQYLEDRGGWLSRETAYKFAEFADIMTKALGDDVYSYATFNEPLCSAFLGYRYGQHAPGLTEDKFGFQAAHHILLAHGLALPKMRENAPSAEHGIVLNFTPAYPADPNNAADVLAADFDEQQGIHWFLQPIIEGQYPDAVRQQQPLWWPTILPGDLELIKQPIDYLGINYYTRHVIKATDNGPKQVTLEGVERTDMGWEVCPQALTGLLTKLNERYELPPIFITENGMAGADTLEDGKVIDQQRCDYYQSHLNAVADAIEQGVELKGYFAWSLMDNFEWAFGYEKRFGIVYVDYDTQQRVPKQSATYFQQFLKQRAGA